MLICGRLVHKTSISAMPDSRFAFIVCQRLGPILLEALGDLVVNILEVSYQPEREGNYHL
jgi:hypothetical protein